VSCIRTPSPPPPWGDGGQGFSSSSLKLCTPSLHVVIECAVLENVVGLSQSAFGHTP
jgi:hypothetical protein